MLFQRLPKVLTPATISLFEAAREGALKQSETLYAVGLYTNPELNYLFPTYNTEEGLLRKAAEYAHRATPTDDQTIFDELQHLYSAILRWNPADWDYHMKGSDSFKETNDLLAPTLGNESVIECSFEALEAVQKLKIFEAIGDTDQPPLLCLFMGDQSDDQKKQWAGWINPKDVLQNFEKELDEAVRADQRLQKLRASFPQS